eukprot:3062445-Prymnesium_polylepis.1
MPALTSAAALLGMKAPVVAAQQNASAAALSALHGASALHQSSQRGGGLALLPYTGAHTGARESCSWCRVVKKKRASRH